MQNVFRRNLLTVLALVGVMIAIKFLDLLLQPGHVYPGRTAVFPWIELLIVTAGGMAGAAFATRTVVIDLWPPGGEMPATPAKAMALGLGLGALLALLDVWLRIGDVNVGLPLAPVFYLWGAISQEVITHFAPAAIVVGVASFLFRSPRAQLTVFWIVAVAMSALAAVGMMGAFQNPDIPLAPQVAAAPMVIGAAVFAIELALFWMLTRGGLLAALVMRLGFYAVWHIAWPAFAY
jgi:hypothetical protein